MFSSFSFLCWEHATNTSIIEVEYDLTNETSLISHYKKPASRLLDFAFLIISKCNVRK
jgi:hypothetical protein